MSKITSTDVIKAVALYGTEDFEITDELIEFAQGMLDKKAEANIKAKIKRAEKAKADGTAEKQAAADAKVLADIEATLGAEGMTRDQILEAMGDYSYVNGKGEEKPLSAQKISTLLAKSTKAVKSKILVGESLKTAYSIQ